MKKLFYPLTFLALILSSAFTFIGSTSWQLAEGYEIKFTSKNPTGIFKNLEGEIVFDENDLRASSFNMKVGSASINTGNGMKNKHAKSEKWFDVEKYPEITYKSSSIEKTDKAYVVIGTLTIKEVSKEVRIPFTFSDNTFSGTFEVSRSEFSLGATKGPQAKAADVLKVDVRVPVTQN